MPSFQNRVDKNTEAHILDERLHDSVLVRHMCHHVGHVVLGGAHQSGTEHDGQVPGLHLTSKKPANTVLSGRKMTLKRNKRVKT